MMIQLLAAILGALAVMTLAGALTGQLRGTRRRAMERALEFEASRLEKVAAASGDEDRLDLIRRANVADNETVNAFLTRFSWSVRRAETLERADLPIKVSEYTLILLAAATVMGIVVMLMSGFVPAAIFAALAAVFVVEWWVKRRTTRRIDLFNEQLPGALQMMAVSLQSGFSIADSIRTVSEDMDAPLSDEFGRLLDETRAGGSFEDSLLRLEERIGTPDLHIAVQALTVHSRVGGNLGEILEQVGETMRDREKLRRDIKSMTAQERMSANIVAALPIWVVGFMAVFSKEAVEPLWTTATGNYILLAAIAFEIVGFWLTRKMTEVEV